MTDQPINLNKFRKAKEREQARDQADANAVKFGRSKAERMLDATRSDKARRMLDAHKAEDDA